MFYAYYVVDANYGVNPVGLFETREEAERYVEMYNFWNGESLYIDEIKPEPISLPQKGDKIYSCVTSNYDFYRKELRVYANICHTSPKKEIGVKFESPYLHNGSPEYFIWVELEYNGQSREELISEAKSKAKELGVG